MKVIIEEDKCCGAGQCVLAAPAVFDQRDDDGVVILLDPEPPAAEHARVRDAITLCPAAVITVQD
ncbi:ferredoxin [Catenuloplanes nepalensis]|uniref:Ferredoxin n=1 Tax=Catenuloplanes nepalensis TaxID=587533 RepID=A0ABT9MNH5_9ACTN|nr:ferredoxin [Catenuloplanes nepalensis]MDP9792989.1 ferredoxin [Catenuloplanes nepalensis]